MGYQKNKEPLKKFDVVKILFGIFIFLGLCALLLNHAKKMDDKIALEQYEISLLPKPDTLIISRDLHHEDNLVKFVDDNYPKYKILEYKHVDSEYSAWNGTHNFYEFILIKK